MDDIFFTIMLLLLGFNLFGLVLLGVMLSRIRELLEEVLRWL